MLTRWKWKELLFSHLIIALLIGTLFWNMTESVWQTIDVFIFKILNGSLEGNPQWQLFWALANHKLADWLEDLCFIALFVLYIKHLPQGHRSRGVAQLIFTGLYMGAIIYYVNRCLFRETLELARNSPTHLVESRFLLSEKISWLKIKDSSTKSFPGDHGTTALLFGALYSYFAKGRLALFAAFYAIFLCLPRLITGAHWFSDVFIGSGSISLFFCSWAFCSPYGTMVIDWIEKALVQIQHQCIKLVVNK